jgi:hypothetical protein
MHAMFIPPRGLAELLAAAGQPVQRHLHPETLDVAGRTTDRTSML